MASVMRNLGAISVAKLGIGLAMAAPATGAFGQEYCVGCSGPDATYRCVIDKAVPSGMPLKMLCISVLARDGDHSTCAVRTGTVFECVGPIRRVDAATATVVKAVDPAVSNSQTARTETTTAGGAPKDAIAKSPRPLAAPANATPQTVEELAKDMTKSSGDALGKAGDAIAGTTKKAWGCLTSFFKSC